MRQIQLIRTTLGALAAAGIFALNIPAAQA